MPVHLFAGEYDKLADTKDVNRLYSELTNSPGKVQNGNNLVIKDAKIRPCDLHLGKIANLLPGCGQHYRKFLILINSIAQEHLCSDNLHNINKDIKYFIRTAPPQLFIHSRYSD